MYAMGYPFLWVFCESANWWLIFGRLRWWRVALISHPFRVDGRLQCDEFEVGVQPLSVGITSSFLFRWAMAGAEGVDRARHHFTIPVGGGVKEHLFLGRLHLLESLKLY